MQIAQLVNRGASNSEHAFQLTAERCGLNEVLNLVNYQ